MFLSLHQIALAVAIRLPSHQTNPFQFVIYTLKSSDSIWAVYSPFISIYFDLFAILRKSAYYSRQSQMAMINSGTDTHTHTMTHDCHAMENRCLAKVHNNTPNETEITPDLSHNDVTTKRILIHFCRTKQIDSFGGAKHQ